MIQLKISESSSSTLADALVYNEKFIRDVMWPSQNENTCIILRQISTHLSEYYYSKLLFSTVVDAIVYYKSCFHPNLCIKLGDRIKNERAVKLRYDFVISSNTYAYNSIKRLEIVIFNISCCSCLLWKIVFVQFYDLWHVAKSKWQHWRVMTLFWWQLTSNL